MELLALFDIIVFSIFGWAVCHALKAASKEAIRVGDALVEESERLQAEFDLALEQAMRELQKPQGDE